jgi:trk system potassium uptake protein TrkH
MKRNKQHVTPVQIIALGFLIMMIIGTGLLLLPISQREPDSISAISAAFTAVSAVSTTGLTVVDTGGTFSTFGYVILAILIQIGGLGVTSIGAGLIAFSRRKMRMREQILVQEALNYPTMKDVQALIRSVLITTITVESICAAVGCIIFAQEFSFPAALGIAVFHSISTFNHAGFDVLGGLISYRDNIPLQLLTTAENILGGLGFYVIRDVIRNRRFSKFSLHTKVVLTTSSFLDISSTLLLKFTEGDSLPWINALFMGITARTSGLSVADVGDYTNASLLLTCILMYIGASPGSTGGGVKVTTIFILMRTMFAYPSGKQPSAFHRRISAGNVQQAMVVCSMFLGIVLIIVMTLCIMQPELPFLPLLFEVVSAFSTVGLSTGITSSVCNAGKVILMLAMFGGRLGTLTVVSLWFRKQREGILLPEESISVG